MAAGSPLADLVERSADEITRRFGERAVACLREPARGAELLDHLPELLRALSASLRAGAELGAASAQAGERHGRQRQRIGADLDQVVREYGLVRQVVIELAAETATPVSAADALVLAQVLSTAVAESVSRFVADRDGALRESEARLRLLAEAMPQMVWTADAQGALEHLNGRWFEYTGAPPGEPLERAWAAIHPDDVGRARDGWHAAARSGERYEAEYRLRRLDGAYRWHLARAVPVRDGAGRIVRWVGTTTDVDDLRQLRDALRDADRRRSEFLGVLSHELRNPLAPIRTCVHVLEQAPPGSAAALHARSVVQRQTEHLARLVDDLLDLTRISGGRIALRRARVDLSEVASRAGDDHRAGFEGLGVALDLEVERGPVWVDGDATRLSQIVAHLLENAGKFTPRGGRVTLSVRSTADAAELGVRDTGVGMAPELLDRVFEPFTQGEQPIARSTGGLGLGLALVRALAELHGGSVRASSGGPGQGAELVVRLPLARAAGDRVLAPARRRPDGARRVLVVDDNRDAAESLAQLVELYGHHAVVAYDGPSAIALAQAHPPDVVLCDIGLPGMTGYEVARALRAQGAGRVRLVAVSGYARPDDVRRSADAGFDRHVAKPADPAEIEQLLA